jgi:hypothetical protein
MNTIKLQHPQYMENLMSNHLLRLRPIQIQDQAQLLSAQAIMAEQNWEFIFGYEPTMAWDQYVQSATRISVAWLRRSDIESRADHCSGARD